jgi:ribosomal protein S7
MQFAKSSNLLKRLKSKKYKITYLEIFISLLIKNGKKKFAKKKIYFLFVLLKKFFFIVLKLKKHWFKFINHETYFLFFLTKLLDSYRPKISLVYKKSAAKIYWIPWYINITKSRVMLIRWLFQSARQRSEKTFILRLYSELLDLFFFKGLTIKKLEEYYAIAVSNRPFLRLLRKKRKISRSRLKKFIT